MAQKYTKNLSEKEKKTLHGIPSDILFPEFGQILPGRGLEEDKETLEEYKDRLLLFRKDIDKVLLKIGDSIQRVDERCGHLKVQTQEEVGGNLYQAMARVFGQGSTVVTYPQYVRALALRKQLTEEDAAVLRRGQKK